MTDIAPDRVGTASEAVSKTDELSKWRHDSGARTRRSYKPGLFGG